VTYYLGPRRHHLRLHVVVALALTMVACGQSATEPPGPAPGEWRDFAGSWNATGTRQRIPLGAERKASIIGLRGTMLFAGADRPDVGFSAEVIALADSETGIAGRSVWTDEHGDQVFSELRGQGTAQRNHIEGKIVGGTGRYAGATGAYEFSWHYVIELEDGSVQGSTNDLKGRIRVGEPSARGSPQ
jgi:hypothetical protein